MRAITRPLAPGETDHELIWLLVTIGAGAMATAWFSLHLGWPICFFHALTGHPCPTCGATRAAFSLFHGDVARAAQWNPLATLVYLGIAAFDLYALFVLAMRKPRLRLTTLSHTSRQIFRAAAVLLLLLNWVYLWHNPLI